MAIIALPLPVRAVYTPENLRLHTKGLQNEINKIVNLETLESLKATTEAETLRKIVEQFRHEICEIGRTNSSLEGFIKEKEIPFPLAYRLIQLLVTPEIQCYDKLKKELSKTCLIFLEFIVFQCGLQERKIYKETADQIKGWLAKIITTLPELELETRFQLRCGEAAAKMLDVGIGKWKEVVKSNAKDIIVGLLTIPTTVPSSMTAAGAILPLVNLSVAIYENLEERWYRNVWALRWYCAGNRITTKAQLNKAYPLMKDSEKNDYHLAFCVSQIFIEIFQTTQNDELRQAVFEEKDISLLKLSKIKEKEQFLGDFWKVRYVTVKHLRTITEDSSERNKHYRQKSIAAILRRWAYEEAQVKILAGSTIAELAPQNDAEWRAQLSTFKLKTKRTLENKLRHFQTNHSELNAQIKLLEDQIKAIEAGLEKAQGSQQHAAGAEERELDIPAAKRVLDEKTCEKEKYLALQQEEEKLNEQLRRLKTIASETPDWKAFQIT